MKFVAWVLTALLAIQVSGCGPSDNRVHVPTIQVHGKLLVDDKPYGPCTVLFSSDADAPDDPKKAIPQVHGDVNADGTFVLSTYGKDDGIPVGKYSVTLGVKSSSDPTDMAKMMSNSAPICKPCTVEIQSSSKEIEVKLETTGETTGPGGVDLNPRARMQQ